MDPSEIIEYVEVGIKGLYWAYTGVLASSFLSCWPFSKKIKSQEELEDIVEEEAGKLGLDSTKIKAVYEGGGWTPRCRATEEGYDLEMKGDSFLSTRKNVRHELYHIFKGDADSNRSMLSFSYFFVWEPRAVLYGSFGIKL